MKYGLANFFVIVAGMAVIANLMRDASNSAIACLLAYFLIGLGIAFWQIRSRNRKLP